MAEHEDIEDRLDRTCRCPRSSSPRCAGPYGLDEDSEAELDCGYVVLSHLRGGDFAGLGTAGRGPRTGDDDASRTRTRDCGCG